MHLPIVLAVVTLTFVLRTELTPLAWLYTYCVLLAMVGWLLRMKLLRGMVGIIGVHRVGSQVRSCCSARLLPCSSHRFSCTA